MNIIKRCLALSLVTLSLAAAGEASVAIFANRARALEPAIVFADVDPTWGLVVRIDNLGLDGVKRYSLSARALRANGTPVATASRVRDQLIEVGGRLMTLLPIELTKDTAAIVLDLATGEDLNPDSSQEATETPGAWLLSDRYHRVDRARGTEIGPAGDPWGCCAGCSNQSNECGDTKKPVNNDPNEWRCTSNRCVLTYDCSSSVECDETDCRCTRVTCQYSCRESAACC